MANFLFNNICFIDLIYGNDVTGKPNNLEYKFQSIDGAYAAMEQLPERKTECITPFTFALSPGLYVIGDTVDTYEAISIESYNGIDGVVPEVFAIETEIAMSGVIISDIGVTLVQSPDLEFRPPINIYDCRWTETVEVEVSNIINFEENYKKSPIEYYKNIEMHKRQGKEYAMKLREENKKVKADIDPEDIRDMLKNQTTFETLARIAFKQVVFNGENIIVILNNILGKVKTIPADFDGRAAIQMIVSALSSILFVGTSDGQPSPFINSVDSVYALLSKFIPGQQINENQEQEITNIIFSDVNINYDISAGLPSNNFVEEIELIEQRFKGYVNRKSKFDDFVPRCNIISQEVSASVIASLEAAQASVDSRMGSSKRPKVAFLDSSVVSNSPNLQIYNDMDYMVDNCNIAGILLPDGNNVMETFPIIRNTEKEGAGITRGSKFLRYRNIKQDYTHNRLDGEFFFVDASENDITIVIPASTSESDNLLWKGRIFEYKRLDCSNHRVKIINHRGKFDNCTSRLLLKSQCNDHCDCGCDNITSDYKHGKYSNDKLAYISFILKEDGNAFIRC